jgi:hypothetical protein
MERAGSFLHHHSLTHTHRFALLAVRVVVLLLVVAVAVEVVRQSHTNLHPQPDNRTTHGSMTIDIDVATSSAAVVHRLALDHFMHRITSIACGFTVFYAMCYFLAGWLGFLDKVLAGGKYVNDIHPTTTRTMTTTGTTTTCCSVLIG